MPVKNPCAYAGCGKTKEKNPLLSFHRFPRHEPTREAWISRCGNADLLLLAKEQVCNLRMCCLHFAEEDILNYGMNGKKIIRPGALPIPAVDVTSPTAVKSEESASTIPASGTVAALVETCPKPAPTETGITTICNSMYDSLKDKKTNLILSRKKTEIPNPTDKLKRLVTALRSEIKKKNQTIKRQKISLEKNASAVAFTKAIYNLNDDQIAFIKMQLNHAKKGMWSDEDKEFALSLYYKSPNAYNFLRDEKRFALPCISLIRAWSNVPDD